MCDVLGIDMLFLLYEVITRRQQLKEKTDQKDHNKEKKARLCPFREVLKCL